MGTDGFQGSVELYQELQTWAVHDGDISPVPAPPSTTAIRHRTDWTGRI
jgi:hypothetical protein